MCKQWKQWQTLFWGTSKSLQMVTAAMKLKKHLLLGRKVMTNLDSILKSRDVTLPTKVHLVKAMAFPVVMYGCEIWTVKKAEWGRIDAFELWCWRRLLRVPWTVGRSNQEISPQYSLEGLMLKLKLQYLATWCAELTHLKRPWCWERLKVGWEGDNRGWDGWMASPTWWTWVCINSRSWWWTGRPGMLQSIGLQRVGYDWATELSSTDISGRDQKDVVYISQWHWHPTPVLLPGKPHGQGSLVGCSPWGHLESDTTEAT